MNDMKQNQENERREQDAPNQALYAAHGMKDAYEFGKRAFDSMQDEPADRPCAAHGRSDSARPADSSSQTAPASDRNMEQKESHNQNGKSQGAGDRKSRGDHGNKNAQTAPSSNLSTDSQNNATIAGGTSDPAFHAVSAGRQIGQTAQDAGAAAAKTAASAASATTAAATGGLSKAAEAGAKSLKALQDAAEKGLEQKKQSKKGTLTQKILSIIAMICVVLTGMTLTLSGSITGANPSVIIKAIAVNNLAAKDNDVLTESERKEKDTYHDFYQVDASNALSAQSAAAFQGAMDYDGAIRAMTTVVENYLDEAYQKAYDSIPGITVFHGQIYTVDKELTQAEFRSQGDPFANVDMAALVAAYATAAGTYDSCNIREMDELFQKASDSFLHVEYQYDSVDDDQNVSGDGKINTLETITARPVYQYDHKDMTLTAAQYLDYLRVLRPGDDRIRSVVTATNKKKIDFLQAFVNAHQDQINDNNAHIRQLNNENTEMARLIRKSEEKIQKYEEQMAAEKKPDKLQGKISNEQEKISDYNARIAQNENAIQSYHDENESIRTQMMPLQSEMELCRAKQQNLSFATIEDIPQEFMDQTYNTTVYYLSKDNNGNLIEIEQVTQKSGKEETDYTGFWTEGDVTYCAKVGTSIWYPLEILDRHYATVILTPYSNDVENVLDMFGLKPQDQFEPNVPFMDRVVNSLTGYDAYEGVTNQMQFKNYLEVLKEQTSLAGYAPMATATHACSLSKDEIMAYVNTAVAQYPNLSPNRQQLIKTALSLTGAIYYQWGGSAKNPGWNDEWWSETGNPDYPYVGLDCSHFVQWAYWTALNSGYQNLAPTGSICTEAVTTKIPVNQIQPGDLGVIWYGGSSGTKSANHVGIYIGKNENGEMMWCHCTGGSQDTVVVNNTASFHEYLRVNGADLEGSGAWVPWDDFQGYGYQVADADAMYIITKCLMCEDSSDVGLMATSEAVCNNIALGGGIPSEQTMLEKCLAPSYLVAGKDANGKYISQYQAIFINKTKDPGEPTLTQYQLIEGAIAGRRQFIQDPRVGYWRSSNITSVTGMTRYGQFPRGSGNNFFYYN